MLCLHGNPTWSYLWRRFLAAAPPGWRVVAPDQLGMGWSERIDRPRTLASGSTTWPADASLGIDGPDGRGRPRLGRSGLAGLGAARTATQLRGLVLTNTGVPCRRRAAPAADPAGPLRAAARTRLRPYAGFRPRRHRTVPARTAARRPAGAAGAVPRAAERRRASATSSPTSRSRPTTRAEMLDRIAAGVCRRSPTCPRCCSGVLGIRSSPNATCTISSRLPQADVQRYPRARTWSPRTYRRPRNDVWRLGQHGLGARRSTRAEPGCRRDPARDRDRRAPRLGGGRRSSSCTGDEVDPRPAGRTWTAGSADLAVGAGRAGVRTGTRVALLIRPGIELTVAVVRLLAGRRGRSWSPTPGWVCGRWAGPCAAPHPTT